MRVQPALLHSTTPADMERHRARASRRRARGRRGGPGERVRGFTASEASSAAPSSRTGGSRLLDLPCEVLVHILRFILLHDVPSVASACRLLHALRAEYIWHALSRK